jgi:integrase
VEVIDLDKEPLVKEWFSSINSRRNTKKAYLSSLHFFTDYVGRSPEELITEAEEEIISGKLIRQRNIKKYLIGFREELQKKGLAPLTVRNYMSAIKSFYQNFDIVLPKISKTGEKAQPLKKHKDIPTKEDIFEVLRVCDPIEKAVLLVGVSSGLSSNEISNLQIKEFKRGYDPKTEITTLDLRREKEDYDFVTFISPEASKAVLEYLNYRNREPKFKNKEKMEIKQKEAYRKI